MTRIAVIPARGGSKRIPRKNIKDFFGKPMIVWSIEAAVASESFDRVIVSTDDDEIAQLSKSFGAEVPFIRPKALSDDFTATVPVIKHAIEQLKKDENNIDVVCCLYATAPFVQALDIKKSVDRLVSQQELDYVFSATTYPFPIQRAIKVADNGQVSMFYPEYQQTRSQDLEPSFHDAGQFYVGRSTAWLEERPIYSSQSNAYILPRTRVQDIDTMEDWRQAELMMQAIKQG